MKPKLLSHNPKICRWAKNLLQLKVQISARSFNSKIKMPLRLLYFFGHRKGTTVASQHRGFVDGIAGELQCIQS